MRVLQRRHLLLPLGDVSRHHHHLACLTGGVLDHTALRFDVTDAPVPEQHAIFRPLADPRGDGFLKNAFDSFLVVRMNFLKRIGALQITGVTHALLIGRAVVNSIPVPVQHRDQVGGIVGNELEKLRALS